MAHPLTLGELSGPLDIVWDITQRCNLNCVHCFYSAGSGSLEELDNKEAKRLVEGLANMNVFSVAIAGGEPFLRDDLFDILDQLKVHGVGRDIATNGMLLTSRIVDILKENGVKGVQVSIDGACADTHDQFRGRLGAFDKAVQALKMLRAADLKTTVSTTATELNYEQIPAILDLCIRSGVNAYRVLPLMLTGRAKENITLLELDFSRYKNLYKFMLRNAEKLREKIYIKPPDFSFLFCDDRSIDFSNRSSTFGCEAGITSCSITPDGCVFPCSFFVWCPEFQVGNVKRSPLKRMWSRSKIFRLFRNLTHLNGKCKKCKYLGVVCNGGCRALAYFYTGDFLGPDPRCWYNPRKF